MRPFLRPLGGALAAAALLGWAGAAQAVGWKRGDLVEALRQGVWIPASVVQGNHGWYKVHYEALGSADDEIVEPDRLRARQEGDSPRNWKAGDAVEVLWKGTWYAAQILEARFGWFKVHYVGYEASWDEIVESNRVRSAPPAGGPVEMRTFAPR